MKAHAGKHLADDATWLIDLLHKRAERGDRRARRLYVKLALPLAEFGARVQPPSWPPIMSPERRAEFAAILKENE
jgi:hypothetical protein